MAVLTWQRLRRYVRFMNLSIYQPALGNERINTKTNTYKEYTYFVMLFCNTLIIFCFIITMVLPKSDNKSDNIYIYIYIYMYIYIYVHIYLYF